ncbi:cytochrome P450 [Kibdelosporangium philippinense]|uniref:Cytochrome P450 n=1 Tax=Kibdelosporangium philippinense TaxID=211113 RepID=A0ABS8ZB67_9PSEU|nr:cytochrome P450 [Kibdelosporangium philippinense]MCE7003783.1 cytochrome P450 [Kibdelosporangium philippinense]
MNDVSPFTETTATARYAGFTSLIESGPVRKVTLFTGVPVWLITRHAEARQALAHPDIVKSITEFPHQDHVPADLLAAMNTHMLMANPPDHTRLRKLVSAVFTRRRIETFEPRIKQISAALLDSLDGSPVDLVSEYAYPLPITVICELIGVPALQCDEFRRLSQIAINGPVYSAETYVDAATEMVGLMRDMITQRRARPQQDLLSELITVRDGGDKLTDDELTSMMVLLLVAGHETTVNLIATGMYNLLSHPSQLDKLRADRSLVPSAVEELLRYDGPAMVTIPAKTNAPVRIGDVTIPAGEVVLPTLSSANRDPRRFSSPDQLDITRDDNQHMAFGHGIHHCLGAPLARLEARVAVNDLLDRFPRPRLANPADEPERYPSLLINGITRLDVLID